jgi:hypothetical protein
MAAFSGFFGFVPSAVLRQAPMVSTPRVTQRGVSDLAATTRRVLVAAGEIALLLWMVLALSFSLLLIAGFLC